MNCKERVWHNEGYQFTSQCERKAVIDGYCKQHHPDSIKKRKAKQQEKWRKVRMEDDAFKENRIRNWVEDNGYKLVSVKLLKEEK